MLVMVVVLNGPLGGPVCVIITPLSIDIQFFDTASLE